MVPPRPRYQRGCSMRAPNAPAKTSEDEAVALQRKLPVREEDLPGRSPAMLFRWASHDAFRGWAHVPVAGCWLEAVTASGRDAIGPR
jgi:hypothetical protein